MNDRLELWAGPECTVNRVGDRYLDQMRSSGFDRRLDDIDRLASLGITRLRFPLIWERTAPDGPASAASPVPAGAASSCFCFSRLNVASDCPTTWSML